jgi:hypothetical protein
MPLWSGDHYAGCVGCLTISSEGSKNGGKT